MSPLLRGSSNILTSLQVNFHATSLRKNASVIDELDVLIGFAELAHEMKFIRPTLSNRLVSYTLQR